MQFVNELISFTHEYESPTSFWQWAAYAAIAATLRDSVYCDHGIQRTYPNIYVLLLADSAAHRKGVPCSLLSSLLNDVGNTKVITGRSSIQGIVEDLANDIGTPTSNVPLKGGCCILLADELASFFVTDPSLIPLITDIYDYRKIFSYRLKSTGITIVKDLCVSMLAASNQTFLNDVYTKAAVFGGLLGRTFIVTPNETRPPNALLDVNLANYNTKNLLTHLNQIKKLRGPINISPAAKTLYVDWYSKLYNSYKDFEDRTGMTQRMHRGVLKLAMILAASDATLDLNLAHMENAIIAVTSLRSNYDIFATVASQNKSNQSEIGAIVLQALWAAPSHRLSRKSILFQNWHKFNSEDLDALIKTLEAAGLINSSFETPEGASVPEVTYSMSLSCIEIFQRKHLAAQNGHLKGTIQ